jgi:hypothetical protein
MAEHLTQLFAYRKVIPKLDEGLVLSARKILNLLTLFGKPHNLGLSIGYVFTNEKIISAPSEKTGASWGRR